MENLKRTLFHGGISLLIGSITAYATYKALSYFCPRTAQEQELELLKSLLSQVHREYLPILKYFPTVLSRICLRPEVVSSPRRKVKAKKLIANKLYEALGEAEQNVISEYGLTQDQYRRLLKQHNKDRLIRGIRLYTKKLVADAAEGKIHTVEVPLPSAMNPAVYVNVFRRLLAIKRQSEYLKHRHSAYEQQAGDKASEMDPNGEKEEIRARVCAIYGVVIKEERERYSFILRRAYYTYMCDREFEKQTELEKAKHGKLVATLKEGWMVPDMEKDVLDISDEELNKRINNQLEYVTQFVEPEKSSFVISKSFAVRE